VSEEIQHDVDRYFAPDEHGRALEILQSCSGGDVATTTISELGAVGAILLSSGMVHHQPHPTLDRKILIGANLHGEEILAELIRRRDLPA
jgi:hypothetical protein